MQVVLNENVKGLGKKLDVVNVSEGYARNYLIPRKLATPADNKSLSETKSKKDAIKFKQDTDRADASAQKEKIEKVTLEFKMKAADNGKLFGSVTSKEIKEKLEEQAKIVVDKKKILLEEQIKTTGMYTAKVKLYEGIVANLRVRIVEI